MTDTVQRALGRIEGTLDQLLKELTQHQRHDTESMDILSKAIGQQRDMMEGRFQELERLRNAAFAAQNDKIDSLTQSTNKAVIGFLASLLIMLGGALITIWTGVLKFKGG